MYVTGSISDPEWIKKARGNILFLIYAFPHHDFHLCWSFGEFLLWLLARTSIFLLPLLDKHHVQQQINEGFSAAARGSGTRNSRFWLVVWALSDCIWILNKDAQTLQLLPVSLHQLRGILLEILKKEREKGRCWAGARYHSCLQLSRYPSDLAVFVWFCCYEVFKQRSWKSTLSDYYPMSKQLYFHALGVARNCNCSTAISLDYVFLRWKYLALMFVQNTKERRKLPPWVMFPFLCSLFPAIWQGEVNVLAFLRAGILLFSLNCKFICRN